MLFTNHIKGACAEKNNIFLIGTYVFKYRLIVVRAIPVSALALFILAKFLTSLSIVVLSNL